MNAPPRRLRGQLQALTLPDSSLLPEHQAFIRALPCLYCGKPAPSECAYVATLAGLATPTDDRCRVPLCGPATVWEDCCHSRKYFHGARFWSELGIQPLYLAFQLWRLSGDVQAGLGAVMRARQAAAGPHPLRIPGKDKRTRCALHRGAALRYPLRPTAMVTPPMGSELPLPVESRS